MITELGHSGLKIIVLLFIHHSELLTPDRVIWLSIVLFYGSINKSRNTMVQALLSLGELGLLFSFQSY